MVRVKHRYILVEILTDQYKNRLKLPLKESEILREIQSAVETIHGDFGVASVQAGLAIKMFNVATRIFIVRVRRNSRLFVATSLPFITSFGRLNVVLRTLHLSGSIRNCLKFLKKYDQRKLTEIVRELQLAPDTLKMSNKSPVCSFETSAFSSCRRRWKTPVVFSSSESDNDDLSPQIPKIHEKYNKIAKPLFQTPVANRSNVNNFSIYSVQNFKLSTSNYVKEVSDNAVQSQYTEKSLSEEYDTYLGKSEGITEVNKGEITQLNRSYLSVKDESSEDECFSSSINCNAKKKALRKLSSSSDETSNKNSPLIDDFSESVTNKFEKHVFITSSKYNGSKPDCDVDQRDDNSQQNANNEMGNQNLCDSSSNVNRIADVQVFNDKTAEINEKINVTTFASHFESEKAFADDVSNKENCFPKPKEQFFLFKTPLLKKFDSTNSYTSGKLYKSVVFSSDDEIENDSTESEIKTLKSRFKTPLKINSFQTPYTSVSWKFKSVFLSPDKEIGSSPVLKVFKNVEINQNSKLTENVVTKSFVKSLSPKIPETESDKDALRYRLNFRKLKYELTSKLFTLFNEKVFSNKLPKDMVVEWNDRLTKTAGYTTYSKDKKCTILLSSKVLDSADRLRDTLLHEMCHAAVWIINQKKDSHGPLWQAWATRCCIAFPDIKMPSRCHNYEILCKFNYKCEKCEYTIGRHSRSLDTSKYKCGKCGGCFHLYIKKL